ncbi:MAG: ribonuclease H-like domain-containing protein [Omnitrophica WOR_2 bacterium]
MPNLSDKLKSLGVKVGAQDIAPPRQRYPYTVEQVIPGRLHPTPAGETYVVDEYYPVTYQYGNTGLYGMSPLNILAEWAGERRISQCGTEAFAYLDIETTGLQGGTGTYAFLIGAGRFENNDFHLMQFFMRDPSEEPAQLLALEEFLAPCDTLVTYNGKAFDVPILVTRYITQGWKAPLISLSQFDLLHLVRRLWRDRMPSRTLGNVETYILGARRTEEDVPGWMIPQLYFDFLRSGDARPLKRVFYHNAMDVLAMAALLNHISHLFEDPVHNPYTEGVDLVGMGRLFEDLGKTEEAILLYRRSLEHELPGELLWDTVQRLSFIYKRNSNYGSAVSLWQQAAAQKQLYAFEELAKYYEHHARNVEEALSWTMAALQIIQSPGSLPSLRLEWQPEMEHRLERLRRKTTASG